MRCPMQINGEIQNIKQYIVKRLEADRKSVV